MQLQKFFSELIGLEYYPSSQVESMLKQSKGLSRLRFYFNSSTPEVKEWILLEVAKVLKRRFWLMCASPIHGLLLFGMRQYRQMLLEHTNSDYVPFGENVYWAVLTACSIIIILIRIELFVELSTFQRRLANEKE